MKLTAISILIISISFLELNAQVIQEWMQSYDGTGVGNNFPQKMLIDSDGNIIVAGNSDSLDYDYIILKYSSSGNLIWKKRYNASANSYDYLMDMVLDDSSNVYVTGESDEGTTLGGVNWVTIKYNKYGEMNWKRSMNWTGNRTDEPFGMNIDKNRNIYVVGFGKPVNNNNYRQMMTVKYSSNGDSLWSVLYRSITNTVDWGYSVVTDSLNNVYSSGYALIPTGNELVTIKYDSLGNEKWVQRQQTNDGDYLRPALSSLDRSGNLIVVGNSNFSNNGDFATYKYNQDGILLWNRVYNGGNIDRANRLFIDSSSNILITGFTFIDTYGDYLILKYSGEGDTLLLTHINGDSPFATDEAYDILPDRSGNIYVTGYSGSVSLTMKLTPLGDTVWTKVYRSPRSSVGYCLALDNSENLYVSNQSEITSTNVAIVTIKYSQLTAIGTYSSPIANSFQLFQNYPNPFNPSTIINYELRVRSFTNLKIYDVLGNEVATLVNEMKNPGNHSVEFDGSNFSSGIYFYKLKAGDIVMTKKMLLAK